MIRKIKERLTIIFNVAYYRLLTIYRYPANILWLAFTPLFILLFPVLIKNFIDMGAFSGFSGGAESLYTFVLLGWGIYFFSNSARGMSGAIENEILQGTFATNLSAPPPLLNFCAGLTISDMGFSGLFSLSAIIIALYLARFISESFGIAILSFFLGLITFFGIGLILMGFSLRFKRIGGFMNIVGIFEQFLAGLFIPILAIPMPLRVISYVIPSTWVIDCFRASMLNLKPLLPFKIELIILLCLAIGFLSLGVYILKMTEKNIKKYGSAEMY